MTIVLANDGDGGRLALRGINKQPSRVREQVEREGMDEESKIAARYARVAGHLDERGRRFERRGLKGEHYGKRSSKYSR